MPSTVTSVTSPSVPTLYHAPYSFSSIICDIINELEIPETSLALKETSHKEQKTDATFGIISPRRVVPVMHFPDGTVMLETGAIALHVLEDFDKDGKLHALPGDPLRRKFLQGMVYATAEAFQATMDLYNVCDAKGEEHGLLKPEQRDQEELEKKKKRFVEVVADHLERELEGGEYYLGEKYSAVDCMFSFLYMCVEYIEVGLLNTHENVAKWFAKVKERESYKKLYFCSEHDYSGAH